MKLVRRPREERSARDRDAIETNEKRERGGREKEKEREKKRERDRGWRGARREEVNEERKSRQVWGSDGVARYLPIIHARDRSKRKKERGGGLI